MFLFFVFVVVVFCFLHAFEEEIATIWRSLPYSLKETSFV